MAQQMIPVILFLEEKDDATAEGILPGLPTEAHLARYLKDVLGDHTKHDGSLGWRVTGARATIHAEGPS